MHPIPHSLCKNQSSRMAMPFFGLALVLLLSLASSCTEQEKVSLLQFLTGLSQDSGLAVSWRDDMDCCTWEGITCNRNMAVVEVSLASRGLEGHISPSLGNLTSLSRLNLSSNSFTGGLPLEVMSSRSIVSLDVSFNRLGSGGLQELWPSIPELPLQVLNISSNFFTGMFPSTTWEKTRNLVVLNASNNSFSGRIPSSFCISSPSFAVLKVGHNSLSGTLPDELFNATLMEYLSFPNNGLQGTLDAAHIIKLGNLNHLDLGGNGLSGMIPDSIGQLKRLEELHLDYNSLSGQLPSGLSKCTNLITINLSNNNIQGELSKVNFSTLPNLKTLDLCRNNLTGTIPESIYACGNLTTLRLSYNKFHGQLSERVGNLKFLNFVSLTSNNFTNITNTLHILKSSRNLTVLLTGRNFKQEAMPHDEIIDGFENLQVLGLDNCLLSGTLPVWLSKFTNMKILLLSNNRFTGPIPSWINTLHFLFYLDISNNSLTGKIPTALTEMPMLKTEKVAAYMGMKFFELPIYLTPTYQYRMLNAFPRLLNVSGNGLTGAIPLEIGQLKALASLDLSFNNFSEGIPQSICNLTNLQVLDLSSNHLTGAIPPALNSLHFLSMFNISNNNLEGPVPSGGQFDTFSSSSFDGNPKLCGSMLTHHCDSAEAPPLSTLSTEQTSEKVVFSIAFGVFFAVGVLYDQIVLSRFFG